MTMVDRRKFRRRYRSAASDDPPEDALFAPLDPQAEAALLRQDNTRRKAETDTTLRQAKAWRETDEQAWADAARRAISPAPVRDAPPPTLTDPLHAARPQPPEEPTRTKPRQPAIQLGPDDAWAALGAFEVDEAHLNRNRLVTASRENAAHAPFDVLRTRLLQALSQNRWKRVAITSPGKDCGKTFTAANLAISLSRQENCRTLLMDCDMRRPSLHRVMGVRSPGSMGDLLRGTAPAQDHLLRMGPNQIHAGRNIAFGFNDRAEPYASELLQDPRTAEALDRIEKSYAPDVMLFDLPPALFYDDVIAFRPLFDGVLLVIGGGLTTEKEIKEVERRLGKDTPLLGMVLNKAEGTEVDRYRY